MKFTVIRVSLGAALLAAAATALAPHATSYVSSSAVVNAPLIDITSPFDGIVQQPSARVSQPVSEGDTLIEIRNARSEAAELQALEAEVGAISGEILGLKMLLSDLDALAAALEERRGAKIEARRAWFDPRLDEARLEIEKAEAEFIRAESVRERVAMLAERGNAPQRDLVDAEADLRLARAQRDQMRAALRRLQIEMESLDGARGVDLSSSDLEQIEYRIDEIAIRRADADARLFGLQTRRAGLKTRITKVSLETIRQQTFTPTSSTDGVIWNASAATGSTAFDGQQVVQLLDCRRRFLEVILPERLFEHVPAGTKARVKLKGSSEPFSAQVTAAYGSAARPN